MLRSTRLLLSPRHQLCSACSVSRRLLSDASSSKSTPHDCDVVIVGGGPAGLALASALAASEAARSTLKVALVEASDLGKVRHWTMPMDAFSNRVSSLTNASQGFLQDIGVWDQVETDRTCPIEDMQVWDGVSDARINFNSIEMGLGRATGTPQMARLTENLNLQRALLRHVGGNPATQLLDKTKVHSISGDEHESGGWPLVHLSDGRVLRARLLVGADGFNSPVRAYAGIQSYGWNYPTHAIVATLLHSPRSFSPNTTAYQRFLPTGPIAFLPLSPTASSLVWSTTPSLAAALVKSDPVVLMRMINAAFRLPEVSIRYIHDRILEAQQSDKLLTAEEIIEEIAWRERSHNIDGHSAHASASVDLSSINVGVPPVGAELLPPLVEGIQSGTVASFPLRFNHAESYIGEGPGARTVLVGDAAHTVHPLAGQGLNLGLADVECLARCIETTILQGGDIGSHTALAPYARERYFENHKMMSMVDKLHKLYSTTFEPIVWARSVGVEVLNELDTLKAAIMMSAGASARDTQARGGASAWNFTASLFETMAGSARFAEVAGAGLRATAIGALQQLARAASQSQQSGHSGR